MSHLACAATTERIPRARSSVTVTSLAVKIDGPRPLAGSSGRPINLAAPTDDALQVVSRPTTSSIRDERPLAGNDLGDLNYQIGSSLDSHPVECRHPIPAIHMQVDDAGRLTIAAGILSEELLLRRGLSSVAAQLAWMRHRRVGGVARELSRFGRSQ